MATLSFQLVMVGGVSTIKHWFWKVRFTTKDIILHVIQQDRTAESMSYNSYYIRKFYI